MSAFSHYFERFSIVYYVTMAPYNSKSMFVWARSFGVFSKSTRFLYGEHTFASPISRSISHLEFFWVSGLSHLPFANAQKVHQPDSNPGPHNQ